jgi:5-methylcytosine-specific restriction endonuclease McrA
MPYKNYNKDMNNYMKNRWSKRRLSAIEYLGGKCIRCGDIEYLEFDHIDPSTKIMTIAKASSRNEVFFWEEVKKCQLLCVPCHMEKSAEDIRNGISTKYKNKFNPL